MKIPKKKISKTSRDKWFIGILSGIIAGIISSILFTFLIMPFILDKQPSFIVKIEENEMNPNSQVIYGDEGSFYWKDSFRKYKITLDNFNSPTEINDLVFIIEFQGDIFKIIHDETQEINSKCKLMDSKVYLIKNSGDIMETTALQLEELYDEKIQGSNKIIVNCERIGQKGMFEFESFVDLDGSQISTTCLYKWGGKIRDYWNQCDFMHSIKISV